MRLATKSILYFVADVGTSLVGFLATLYFARVLGAGPLGQYFLVIALMGWLTIPTNGIASAVNKRISEGRDPTGILSTGTAMNATYGVAVSLLVVLAGRWVNAYVGAEVSFVVAALLFVHILFTTALEALKGKKMVAHAGFLRTGDRVLRVGAQVGFLFLGYRLFALLGGHAVALVVSSVVGLVLFGFRPSLSDFGSLRSLVAYGRYSWLGAMKSKTFGWMDTLVLGLFVSSGLIGVYEVAWRLASILILVSNAVETTLFPEVSDLAADGERERVQDLLSEALFFAGIFAIPGFFGVLVLGPKILRIYGPEFVQGAPILLILVFARAVNVYEMQFINVINGVDRPDVAFRINLVFVAANVGLNVLLVWQFGWLGAAVATTLSTVVILLLSFRAVDDLVGTPAIPLAGIGGQVAAGGVMAVAIVFARRTIPVENMYVTVALVGFGAVVYGGVLYAFSGRVRAKVRSFGPGVGGADEPAG